MYGLIPSVYRFALYSFVGLACLAGLLAIGYYTPHKAKVSHLESCAVTLYVRTNWLHTKLIVPVTTSEFDWTQYLNLNHIGFSGENYSYLSFGWGDREHYLNAPTIRETKLDKVIGAFAWPTPPVMKVEGYTSPPLSESGVSVIPVQVDSKGYTNLSNFILDTFRKDDNEQLIFINQAQTDNSSFFEAQGRYSALENCNNWVANALFEARVNTPLWSSLSSSVQHHLQNACYETT